MRFVENKEKRSHPSKSRNMHEYRFFEIAIHYFIIWSIVWETSQEIQIYFLGGVIKPNHQKLEGWKVAKKLKNWTLILAGKGMPDWTDSLHSSDLPDDFLSNKCIFMSVTRIMRNRRSNKCGKKSKIGKIDTPFWCPSKSKNSTGK